MSKGDARNRPEMEIRISGLPEGEYPFRFEIPAEHLQLDRFEGNIELEGKLQKVSTQFFVSGTVTAMLNAECDRCLAEIHREFKVPLAIYYDVSLEPNNEDEGGDLEMRRVHPEQDSIALDDEVRETLLLNVPLKNLCKETCEGICAGCGADLNMEECRCEAPAIDPRWAKLAEAFKKNN